MLEKFQQIISKDRIKTNVPMSTLTTFKTGGNADIILYPEEVEELKNILKFLYEIHIPYYVMGNGSNLLVSDEGIRRDIIKRKGSCCNKSR